MGAIINYDDIDSYATYVDVSLTSDEARATIEAIRHALDHDTPLRDTLTSALTAMTFAFQQTATATFRRQLAEDLLDRARTVH
jgi:hypothetical protein